MKNFLMLPLLAFALFACESNETENQTSLDEVEGSVIQSNLTNDDDDDDDDDLWSGFTDGNTITLNLEVTEIRDWDGVVVRYTTEESERDNEETRWKEVEAETEILDLDGTTAINAFIDPDADAGEDDTIKLSLVPYMAIGNDDGQLYEDAVEEVFLSNGLSLDGTTYDVEIKTSYDEYINSTPED